MDIAKLGILVDSRDVRGATGDLRTFARESDGAEASVKRLGRTAIASLGAFASAATLQQAARHTLGFKAAMAEVSTLLDTQPGQMDKLARSARNLAKEYGTSATSQAQAYYQAISAGATGAADATRILDTANRLAIGGVTDVTTGVDILTTAMNAYRSEGLTASQASDALFVGMRAGKTTIAELSGSLGTVIPLARAMGVSFDEVVAGTAALTTQGIKTSEAVTGLRAALTAVTNPSKQAADLADALGLKFDSQALAAKGLEGFLADVIEKTGGSSDAMSTLFSSTEATTAALALAGGGSEQFSKILEDMKGKAGATATAFDKMSKDDLQRLNVAMSTIADRALTFGQVVLTVAIPALETLAGNLNLLLGMATAASVVFTTRLAISVGTTFVKSAVAAVGQAIALEIALGATSKSAALASLATKGLSRSLTLLKGAVAATGFGLLVVGGGILVVKFLDLVKATGGWGNALKLLGDVAKGVWQGVVSSAEAIPVGLSALWVQVKSNFVGLLSDLQSRWAKFLTAFHQGALDAGFDGLAKSFGEYAKSAWLSYDELEKKSGELASESERLKKEAETLATQGFEQAKNSAKKLADAVSGTTDELEDGEDTADAFTKALNDIPAAATNTESGLKDAAEAAKGFNETLKDAAYTAEEFGAEKAGIMISGIDGLSNAWGDFVASGFRDFSSFKDAILGTFKSLLAQMIALAARNRIMISLGLGGVTGSAASLGSGIVEQGGLLDGGGSGLLGSLFGGGSGAAAGGIGIGSALIGGFSNVVGATFTGGLGAGLATIGGQLGAAATGSLTAVAGAIGAIAAPLLAVAGIFSFFKKKTKLLDAGLRITVDGFEAAIETFKETETSRFWGLSKKRSTTYTAADAELADPLALAVSEVQNSVVSMADVLGFGSSAFEGFVASIQFSTKDLTDEQIAEEFQNQMGIIADGMAEIVLADQEVSLAGESASETLTRLSTHLQSTNAQFELLGLNLYDVSIAGADAASQFVQLFTSLDEFNQLTASYYANFYSDAERLANAQSSLEETMQSLGFSSIPETHAQFRMLVDAMSEMGDQEGLATLLKIAPAFNEIANASAAMMEAALNDAYALQQEAEQAAQSAYSNVVLAIEAERDAVVDSWSSMLDDLGELTSAAADRASEAMRLAGIVFDAQKAAQDEAFTALQASYETQIDAASIAAEHSADVLDLLDRAISERTGATSEQMRRSQALALIRSGDTSDISAIENALSTLNEPSQALHSSYVEYARDFAVTSSAIASLRENTAATLTTEEQIVANLESQMNAAAAAYEAEQEYLDQQLVALEAQIDLLNGIDTSLQGAIAAIYGSNIDLTDAMSAEFGGANQVVEFVEAAVRELANAAEQERIAQEAADAQISAADSLAAQQIEALNHSVAGILQLDQNILTVTSAIDTLDASILELTSAQFAVNSAEQVYAAAQLREAQVQNSLTAELLALQVERERQQQIDLLQEQLSEASAALGDAPLVLEIVKEVARGGSLFSDYASYVTLNDGQSFSSKTGSSSIELAHARAQAQGVIDDSYSAFAAWAAGQDTLLEPLRQQIVDLGGVPQFASGGSHAGGWRVVGERGWELEHTGPSRVVSNSDARDMLDNRPLVEELKALRKEVEDLRRENMDGNVQIAKHAKKSADIAQHNKLKAELEIVE